MKLAALLLVAVAGGWAQSAPGTQVVASSQRIFGIAKNDVMGSVEKIPENLWQFRPTPEVRTVAQMFAHIADGQYEFCSPVNGEKIDKGIEKTANTKAEIVTALKQAFAYCDATFAKMTEASAVQTVEFFGGPMSRVSLMDFNTAHVMEHYGNLVTYMRIKGIVPPSSQGQ